MDKGMQQKYIETQVTIIKIGQMANRLDLDTFMRQINQAETIGPILDPTLSIKAAENLTAIKKLAKAVSDVKTAYEATLKAVLDTKVREFEREQEG